MGDRSSMTLHIHKEDVNKAMKPLDHELGALTLADMQEIEEEEILGGGYNLYEALAAAGVRFFAFFGGHYEWNDGVAWCDGKETDQTIYTAVNSNSPILDNVTLLGLADMQSQMRDFLAVRKAVIESWGAKVTDFGWESDLATEIAFATPEQVAQARAAHQEDGRCEIDDRAQVSVGDEKPIDGMYVQAWVWIDTEES